MGDTIMIDQEVRDVRVLAGRLALLYRCFCEELEQEFGSEITKDLVRHVVAKYGKKCGQDVRKVVDSLGVDPVVGNYSLGQDLPSVGWEIENIPAQPDELRMKIKYCPLASAWKALGQSEYDRLYCYVDQTKYSAYNPDLECVHLQNCLDGDPVCELLVRNRA